MSNTAKCGNERTNATRRRWIRCTLTTRENKTAKRQRPYATDEGGRRQQNDDDSGCVQMRFQCGMRRLYAERTRAMVVVTRGAGFSMAYARARAKGVLFSFVRLCRGENTILYSFYFEIKRATRAKRGRQLHTALQSHTTRETERPQRGHRAAKRIKPRQTRESD